MSNLRSLLQDADPLRHEPPRRDTERERVRLTMLRSAGSHHPVPLRAHLGFLAVLAVVVMSAMAAGYQLWLHAAVPVLAAVRFELRLAEDQPIPGLVVAGLPGSDRVIYLYREVVVSNDDIAQTWVTQDAPDRFGVGVQLLPSGSERLRQATASHIGRPVAILIDGRVVTAPVVRSPIGDSAAISGNYTRAEAERIAEGIARR